MDYVNQTLSLSCPECHDPMALYCVVEGTRDNLSLTLIDQACACDVHHVLDDVWEDARDIIFQ